MRALRLERPAPAADGPLRLVELPEPVAGPGELVLRVGACAVCRTDLQLAEGDLPLHRSPVVPGHQAVGVVAAVGEGVEGWQAGERAAVTWLASACGVCPRCREGRENLCAEARFTGWDVDGGFAEQLVVRAAFAVRPPPGFDDVAAAPLLCGGAIGYRSLRVAGVQPGSRLGLYGFGASARIALQVARHRGCEVAVCTRSANDREAALALGAAWAGATDDRPPWPLDAAITFAPSGDVVVAALRALDRGGTVAINAIHLDRVPQLAYEELWWERAIRSVANVTRRDAQELLALAAEVGLRTETETHALADGNEALRRLADGEVAGAAVLVP